MFLIFVEAKCLGEGLKSSLKLPFVPDKTACSKMLGFFPENGYHRMWRALCTFLLNIIFYSEPRLFILLEHITILPSESSTSGTKVIDSTVSTEYFKHYNSICGNATDIVTDTSDDLFFLYGKFTFTATKISCTIFSLIFFSIEHNIMLV